MQKWDYLTINEDVKDTSFNRNEKLLKECGKNGWELVTVLGSHQTTYKFIFKKPILEAKHDKR